MKAFIEAGLIRDKDEYMERLTKARPSNNIVHSHNQKHIKEWKAQQSDFITFSEPEPIKVDVPAWTPNKSAIMAMKMMRK
jgi:hypothetical protein